jgi:hypothetical protein
MKTASVTLIVAVLIMGLIACGETDDGQDAFSDTASLAATPQTPPPDPAKEATGALRRYHQLVESYSYGAAWGLLGSGFRSEQGSFNEWRDGYELTVKSQPSGIKILSATPRTVSLTYRLRAVDIDVCGTKQVQQFEGPTVLKQRGGRWSIYDADLQLISGDTPATDISECQQESPEPVEPVEPAAASGCHSSYVGACLDSSAPDYDCEGGSGDGPLYTGPVQVVGSDPFGLDSDGDGSACE